MTGSIIKQKNGTEIFRTILIFKNYLKINLEAADPLLFF
jgi:hypothetical protein